MPLYFFDTDNGADPRVDHVGRELPDDEAAPWAGLDTLPDVARDRIAHSDHRTFGISVRNAQREVIYAATLALMGGWKKPR
ncbi:hypothetical protein C8D03_0966 [Bosea sp. 124]|nr:hypothetical protein C8D03_0966 [Bosea sp. 124]